MPIDIEINRSCADIHHNVLLPIEQIDTEAISKMKDPEKNRIYAQVKDICRAHGLHITIDNGEDEAHQTWSQVQEIFLHACVAVAHEDNPTIIRGVIFELTTAILNKHFDKDQQGYDDKTPQLTRGSLRRTANRKAVGSTTKGCITSTNLMGEMLTSLEHKCAHLKAWVKRAGEGIVDIYEARVLATKTLQKAELLIDKIEDTVPTKRGRCALLLQDTAAKLFDVVKHAKNEFTMTRQRKRTSDWIQKLQANWKQNGGKAFFRYIANNDKVPLASFEDPEHPNVKITDPWRIDELFRKYWSPIYNYTDEETPPDWDQFHIHYGQYITDMGAIPDGPITGPELHARAKKLATGSSAGLDSLAPRELRALPSDSWNDRAPVENLFLTTGKYPSVYLQVPLTMLRKGEGLTPTDHRGISIFVAHYRLSAGVWWERILPACSRGSTPMRAEASQVVNASRRHGTRNSTTNAPYSTRKN